MPKQHSLTLLEREHRRKKRKFKSQNTPFALLCFIVVLSSLLFFILFMMRSRSHTDKVDSREMNGDNINVRKSSYSNSNIYGDNNIAATDGGLINVWDELIAHLSIERLKSLAEQHKEEYASAYPFKHITFNNLIPRTVLDALLDEIPESLVGPNGCYSNTTNSGMQPSLCKKNKSVTNFQYKKSNIRTEEDFGPVTRQVINFFQSIVFVRFLRQISGIAGLIPDHTLNGGGIHLTARGGKLDLHADFNSQPDLKLDRRVNLFLFLNPDWEDEYGGHLELWNKDMTACGARILPSLGKLVIFSTTDFSHHGHPHPLTAPEGRVRRSIALYYYTVGRPAWECLDGECPRYGKEANYHGTLWQKPVGCEKCMDCFQSNF